MSGTIRTLVVLALVGTAGCIVGPQEDLPLQHMDPPGEGNRGAGADGDAAADGDADMDEPAPYDDDGAFWNGEGVDTDDADPDSENSPAGVFEDALVPGLPAIPRPGLPTLNRGLPDLGTERSDDAAPPDLDAAGLPGGELTEDPSDD